ncbi:hypothetical protein ThrDRAFT_04225 [Frankia casuarinae]|uniref:Endonuclease/exonuclease/phosphatase n=1 Tax=Frankia casuarinae (strain DSM 45818 / CECT 9043 / HFP020203 / CcI3) TaxID=106370 RepID=Q2J807_FRACC|nr:MULTISPECIES: endonuclease/exonuclease/phosphatase family protein [Frankia]ABD12585.1 Endonuclease/exonuclease/phosphatase [Frankia casuarinae]ETA00237.1 hypothetical protein CcI6DRAFT_04348 [Frankia sp. CcI6]EYT90158.1 hypothetical protein ThrDRAFT_04225 [Frankia casuarinae]KDA41831.1 hypothetical protein BMG523Draft_03302 [Frankia sp. BMG5.23]OAA19086.1 metal-dependent hydrolase [Frankia casuarinae]
MRLASFNVENLFERIRAMDLPTWDEGQPVLAAFDRFITLAQHEVYTVQNKTDMLADLETMEILTRTSEGRLQLNRDPQPRWARLRENRGNFLTQPPGKDAVIDATGRQDWIGWVELVTGPVDETAIRSTAQVITDINADVLAVIEAENRPALVRFNTSLLAGLYAHVMLVDGNDPRGIDVGLLAKPGHTIGSIVSHVDDPDPARPDRPLFSRDCPAYELHTPAGNTIWVLPNHLKSQSWTSGNPDPLRRRQAHRVAEIYTALRDAGARYIAVVGDLNKPPPPAFPSLEPLLGPDSPLVDAASRAGFDTGPRPGTFQSCTARNRLDYILLSPDLADRMTGGQIVRTGLWGDPDNKHPSAQWVIHPKITRADQAASDHAALYVDLDI